MQDNNQHKQGITLTQLAWYNFFMWAGEKLGNSLITKFAERWNEKFSKELDEIKVRTDKIAAEQKVRHAAIVARWKKNNVMFDCPCGNTVNLWETTLIEVDNNWVSACADCYAKTPKENRIVDQFGKTRASKKYKDSLK